MVLVSPGRHEGRQPLHRRGFPSLLAPDCRTVDRGDD